MNLFRVKEGFKPVIIQWQTPKFGSMDFQTLPLEKVPPLLSCKIPVCHLFRFSQSASHPQGPVHVNPCGFAFDMCPEPHVSVHLVHVDAPTTPLHIPGAVHVVQLPTPITALYVPIAHGVQATPSNEPWYPGGHVHIELPASDQVCSGQFLHAVTPSMALNVPGAQAIQSPIGTLYVPDSHKRHSMPPTHVYPGVLLQTGLPASENELPGHGRQVVDAMAATAVEEKFTPHGVQAASPGVGLYVPPPHGVHASPPTPVYPASQVHDVS